MTEPTQADRVVPEGFKTIDELLADGVCPKFFTPEETATHGRRKHQAGYDRAVREIVECARISQGCYHGARAADKIRALKTKEPS